MNSIKMIYSIKKIFFYYYLCLMFSCLKNLDNIFDSLCTIKCLLRFIIHKKRRYIKHIRINNFSILFCFDCWRLLQLSKELVFGIVVQHQHLVLTWESTIDTSFYSLFIIWGTLIRKQQGLQLYEYFRKIRKLHRYSYTDYKLYGLWPSCNVIKLSMQFGMQSVL